MAEKEKVVVRFVPEIRWRAEVQTTSGEWHATGRTGEGLYYQIDFVRENYGQDCELTWWIGDEFVHLPMQPVITVEDQLQLSRNTVLAVQFANND